LEVIGFNMPVNINAFKLFVEAISNKSQSGNTVTVSEFEIFCHQAQMQVFEKDRLTFLKTGDSSDFLDWFLKSTTINPSTLTGYAPYPKDFQHTAGVRAYYNKIERPVELVENKAWGEVQASKLFPPTRLFPKYTEFASEYRFLPKNIGIVMLDYWKEPVKPVWGWTIVNNNQVYDPSTSVDFEWADFATNQIASVYLSLIGCNLKDKELEGFSQQFKAENNNLL
jgi:hypothetical protein